MRPQNPIRFSNLVQTSNYQVIFFLPDGALGAFSILCGVFIEPATRRFYLVFNSEHIKCEYFPKGKR